MCQKTGKREHMEPSVTGRANELREVLGHSVLGTYEAHCCYSMASKARGTGRLCLARTPGRTIVMRRIKLTRSSFLLAGLLTSMAVHDILSGTNGAVAAEPLHGGSRNLPGTCRMSARC